MKIMHEFCVQVGQNNVLKNEVRLYIKRWNNKREAYAKRFT